MQTIEDYLIDYMYQRGLFKEDATKILANLKNKDYMKQMKNSWKDDKDNYPKLLMVVVLKFLKKDVIAWMDNECPQHWGRKLFL